MTDLVLSIISDDQPGIVESLAQTVSDYGGNWQESHMTQLAGKFAGILRISVEAEKVEALRQALNALDTTGFKIMVENACCIDPAINCISYSFAIIGADRQGIVRELAHAFSCRDINMEQLSTDCSSAPWSGEPLFKASGTLQVPEVVNTDALYDHLDAIADELGIDITLEEMESFKEAV